MKLTRVTGVERGLSGEWLSVDVSGSALSESISISESQFELCGGKGVVSYSYSELSRPLISFKVMKTGGCVQNEIYSSLSRSVYMRWKGSNLVYLYNGEFEQIMSMRRIGDRIVNTNNNVNTVPIVQDVINSNVNKLNSTNNINFNINNNNNNNNNNINVPNSQPQSSTNKPNTSNLNQQNTQNQYQNTQTQTQNVQPQIINSPIINQQQSSSYPQTITGVTIT